MHRVCAPIPCRADPGGPRFRGVVDNTSRRWLSLMSAVVFFVLVVLIQLLLEWIFGDAVDAAFIRQAVITSVIMTALFALFTWWRGRRSRGQQ
jgi:hypothetical protein